MGEKPFWEQGYSDNTVSTFSKGPTEDVEQFWSLFPKNVTVLDVGCGEGRNSIFFARMGYKVDAFDISEKGIAKAKAIAAQEQVNVNFFVCDLDQFLFEKQYGIILSHGVLHLPRKEVRNRFIQKMQENTLIGGVHAVGVFTNRLPATPDNAPFTHSLFDVGELPARYDGWEMLHHLEGTFHDTHPGDIHHEHAFERIIALRRR